MFEMMSQTSKANNMRCDRRGHITEATSYRKECSCFSLPSPEAGTNSRDVTRKSTTILYLSLSEHHFFASRFAYLT